MEIDGSIYREKFLDCFPLSDAEVDRLICLYNTACSDQCGGSLAQLHRRLSLANEQGAWLNNLQHVEDSILPNVLDWILKAPNHVAPLLPFDVPDDETVPLCRAFYFLEAMVSLLGRRGTRFLVGYAYDMTPKREDKSGPTATALVDFVYRHMMAAIQMTTYQIPNEKHDFQAPKAWVESLIQSAGSDSNISRMVWTQWINDTLPEAVRALSTFYHHALFSPEIPFGPTSPKPFLLPQPEERLMGHPSNNLLLPLSLACISPALGGPWYQLYSSSADGFSFLGFQNAMLRYVGPTCLLIRPKGQAGTLGYYTDCPWKDHGSAWFGGEGHDSFLFAVGDNRLGVYWPTWEGKCYQYLNTATRANNNSAMRGLAVGGISSDIPRLHLTLSLEQCKATSTDTTYASGPLLEEESPFFDVDTLELWAVNATPEEFHKRKKSGLDQAARKEETRQRAAKVDRAQFLEDFQSGLYLNDVYSHRDQCRGRHDFVASEDGGGYHLEDKPPSESAMSPRSAIEE